MPISKENKILFLSKLFVCLIFILQGSQYAICQDSIQLNGRIVDSIYNQPIENVSLSIKYSTGEIKVIGTSKTNGSFSIRLPFSNLTISDLIFTCIGYKEMLAPYRKSNIDIGVIKLIPINKELKEVVVKSTLSLIRIDADKFVYNADKDTSNKGFSAIEVLQKAPLMFVDNNGGLYLKGEKNFKILINGKDKAQYRMNPGEIFKTIPAELIQKVEVSTVLTAKYAGEGYAGIVNIIMDKQNNDRFFVSTGLGTDTRGGYNALGFINTGVGKFGLTLNVNNSQTNGVLSSSTSNTYFKDEQVNISQPGSIRNRSNSLTIGADLSYEVDSSLLLNFSIYNFTTNVKTKRSINTYSIRNSIDTFDVYTRNIEQHLKMGFNNFGLDIQKIFRNKSMITISQRSEYIPNNTAYDILQNNLNTQFTFTEKAVNKAHSWEHTGQIDFVQPLKNSIQFETGVKSIFRTGISQSERESPYWNPVQQGSEDFKLKQDVLGYYANINKRQELFYYTIGGKLENTMVTSGDFRYSYLNFLPSISYNRVFKKAKSTVGLNFNSALARPGIRYLNPFNNNVNPNLISKGNPKLEPELVNKISIDFNSQLIKKATTSLSFYYKYSNNLILPYSFKTGNDTTLISSFANNGRLREPGINLYISFNLLKKMSIRLTSDLSYYQISNSLKTMRNSSIAYKIFSTVSYSFPKQLKLSFNGYFYSRKITFQGETSSIYDASFTLSKGIFEGNGSLAIVFSQPFTNKQIQKSIYEDNSFKTETVSELRDQFLKINFRYTFGQYHAFYKAKKRGIKKDDIKE